MTAPTVTADVRCQQCGAVPKRLEHAEPDLAGWIRYRGRTIGGQPHEATLCPECASKMRTGRPDPTQTGFDAWCSTCMTTASDENDHDLTEDEAEEWAEEHQCEPDVQITPPQGKP